MGSSEMAVHIRTPVLMLMLSILFFMLCDSLIFRSGWYDHRFASTDTTAGTLAHMIYFENKRPPSGKKEVLIVGNSKINMGFSIGQFEREHPGATIQFIQGSCRGIFEQAYYYILKALDPHQERYAAIVIPLENYKINPWRFEKENAIDTIQTIAPILSAHDTLGFLSEYTDRKALYNALIIVLFRSHGYALDLQDLIMHPQGRRDRMKGIRRNSLWHRDSNYPADISLEGIKVDPDTGKVLVYPPDNDAFDRKALSVDFLHETPQEAEHMTQIHARYFNRALNKIVELYHNSKTQLIFVQMPRWPMTVPGLIPIASAPDIRDMVPKQSNVTFIDENEFVFLEHLQYFHDISHLNKAGQIQFTRVLGNDVLNMMGAH